MECDVVARLEHVSREFGGRVAIEDICLTVEKQEFVCLVGPSGCGKTTILNLLAGETSASSGLIEVLGTSPRLGHPGVGYMYARDALLPWRTARKNVEFGLEARGYGREERSEMAIAMLREVGLEDFSHYRPQRLSQGMRQRVALARTFVLPVELLLMDEPFAAVDAQTRLELQEILLRLWSARLNTVVFVTHDLREALRLGDRVIVMTGRPGRVAKCVEAGFSRSEKLVQFGDLPDLEELYNEVYQTLTE